MISTGKFCRVLEQMYGLHDYLKLFVRCNVDYNFHRHYPVCIYTTKPGYFNMNTKS